MRRRRIDRPTVSHEAAPGRGRPVGAGPAPVGRPRFFVALLPDAAAAGALAELARALAAQCGGQPLAAPDVHLTLAFIGARDAAFGETLERAVAPLGARHRFAPLCLPRIGRFGHGSRPALLWAGPDATPDWLGAIDADVRRMLRELSCGFDERPLVPHLTLVRGANPGAHPAPALAPPVRVASWRLAIGRNRPAGGPLRYAWSGHEGPS
jgi:2'-5' RNA ligase